MTNQTNVPKTLTGELLRSLGNAPWLTPSDAATVQWAIFLAAELDDHGDQRVVANLGKLYESALHSLGLSPEARSAKVEHPRDEVNPLAEIIAIGQPVAKAANAKQAGRPKSSKPAGGSSRSSRPAAAPLAKDSN